MGALSTGVCSRSANGHARTHPGVMITAAYSYAYGEAEPDDPDSMAMDARKLV